MSHTVELEHISSLLFSLSLVYANPQLRTESECRGAPGRVLCPSLTLPLAQLRRGGAARKEPETRRRLCATLLQPFPPVSSAEWLILLQYTALSPLQ